MPSLMPGWEEVIKRAVTQNQDLLDHAQSALSQAQPEMPAPQPEMPAQPVQPPAQAPIEMPAPAPAPAPSSALPPAPSPMPSPKQKELPEEAKPGLLSEIITGGLAALGLKNPAAAIEALKQKKLQTYQMGEEAKNAPATEVAKAQTLTSNAGLLESTLSNEKNLMNADSVVSQLARKEAGALFGAEVSPKATAKDILAIMPTIGTLLEKKYGLEMKALTEKGKVGEKNAEKSDVNILKTTKQLNGLEGSQSPASVALAKIATSDLINNELNGIKRGVIIPSPAEMTRLSTMLSSLEIRGSRIPWELIRHSMDLTAKGKTAEALTFLTSKPQNASTPSVLDQIQNIANTDRALQVKKATQTIQSSYKMHKKDFENSPGAEQRFIDSILAYHTYLTPEEIRGESSKVNMNAKPNESTTTSSGFNWKVR